MSMIWMAVLTLHHLHLLTQDGANFVVVDCFSKLCFKQSVWDWRSWLITKIYFKNFLQNFSQYEQWFSTTVRTRLDQNNPHPSEFVKQNKYNFDIRNVNKTYFFLTPFFSCASRLFTEDAQLKIWRETPSLVFMHTGKQILVQNIIPPDWQNQSQERNQTSFTY